MANPHPVSKFQKGNKVGGRKSGQPNLVSRDLKTLIREAAAEAGFVERVPVGDAEGRPTPVVFSNLGISEVASSFRRTLATVLSSALVCLATVALDTSGRALRNN
jgi:hypothetical protein